MPRNYTYNVYDNGELICENATHKEIAQLLGCIPKTNLREYVERNIKFKRRYTFKYNASCKQRANFDLEAVVSELTDFSENTEKFCEKSRCDKYENGCAECVLHKALDIVRKGGVDNAG